MRTGRKRRALTVGCTAAGRPSDGSTDAPLHRMVPLHGVAGGDDDGGATASASVAT
jgi:hypothetical protein